MGWPSSCETTGDPVWFMRNLLGGSDGNRSED